MGSDSIYSLPHGAAAPVVLDTNIVLDLWIFADPATPPLRQALNAGELRWLATASMREELRRVLDYPHIGAKLAYYNLAGVQVLERFDALAQLQEVPPKASFSCKDTDDQKFIDLAAAHQALLISKDKAVLCMARRLQRLGVTVRKSWPLV